MIIKRHKHEEAHDTLMKMITCKITQPMREIDKLISSLDSDTDYFFIVVRKTLFFHAPEIL
jgi:hypothetical protein